VLERSIEVLANELRVADAYGARFLNVHIGSHRGAGVEAGAARLADGLREVQRRLDGAAAGVTLVLENVAGSGFGLGSTIGELLLIDQASEAAGWTGPASFCLDTAHLWAPATPSTPRPA
jgi:deoxyribonuclease-4